MSHPRICSRGKHRGQMINLGMHTNCKVSCGKNKQIFKTSERKCPRECQPLLNAVCLGVGTRKGPELLLPPHRVNVAQKVNSGSRSHPNSLMGRTKVMMLLIRIFKNLENNFSLLVFKFGARIRRKEEGEKLGVRRFFFCLQCGKGQQSEGKQQGPRCVSGGFQGLLRGTS